MQHSHVLVWAPLDIGMGDDWKRSSWDKEAPWKSSAEFTTRCKSFVLLDRHRWENQGEWDREEAKKREMFLVVLSNTEKNRNSSPSLNLTVAMSLVLQEYTACWAFDGLWVKMNKFRIPWLFLFMYLEKEMATHSSVLAWRIPGTGEPGGLPSLGLHRVRHDWSNLAATAAASPLLNYTEECPFALQMKINLPSGVFQRRMQGGQTWPADAVSTYSWSPTWQQQGTSGTVSHLMALEREVRHPRPDWLELLSLHI